MQGKKGSRLLLAYDISPIYFYKATIVVSLSKVHFLTIYQTQKNYLHLNKPIKLVLFTHNIPLHLMQAR